MKLHVRQHGLIEGKQKKGSRGYMAERAGRVKGLRVAGLAVFGVLSVWLGIALADDGGERRPGTLLLNMLIKNEAQVSKTLHACVTA